MSLGQLVEEWSGSIEGEIIGEVQFDLALSNIDSNAPDGMMGPTELLIEISVD